MDYRKPTATRTILIVAAVLLALVRLIVEPNISLAGVTPDILFILVCIIGFARGSTTGVIAGFIIGLIADLLGLTPIGLSSLLFCVTGYLTGTFDRNLFEEEVRTPILMLAVTALVYHIAKAIFMTIFGMVESFGTTLLQIALPGTLYTIVVGALVILLISRFMGASHGRLKGSQLR